MSGNNSKFNCAHLEEDSNSERVEELQLLSIIRLLREFAIDNIERGSTNPYPKEPKRPLDLTRGYS